MKEYIKPLFNAFISLTKVEKMKIIIFVLIRVFMAVTVSEGNYY